MKCPDCGCVEGTYREVEDFNPGGDPEWSYYEFWHCHNCDRMVYDYQEEFEYGDDDD